MFPSGIRIIFGLFGLFTLFGLLWSLPYSPIEKNIAIALSGLIMLFLSFGTKESKPPIALSLIGIVCHITILTISFPTAEKIDSYGSIYFNIIVIILYLKGVSLSLDSKNEQSPE